MTRFAALFLPLMLLAACERSAVNPPTEPAAAIDTPDAAAPPPTAPPGVDSMLPGAGPASFVGRWAADVDWCANVQGPQRPIEISTTRLEGYENSCAIASIAQIADGYDARLVCTGEGQTTREGVRLAVQGDALRLTWLDRNGAVVLLARCKPPEAAPAPAS